MTEKFGQANAKLALDSHIAEFDEWAWRDIEEMPDLVVDFKKELYLKLIEKFSPIKDKIKSN